MSKPNCYECKWRGSLPWDCHSSCNHPALEAGNGGIKMVATLAFHLNQRFELLNVTADESGIRQGFFLWPINFDPVWLLTCDGFEKKEVSPIMGECKASELSRVVSPTNATNATNA